MRVVLPEITLSGHHLAYLRLFARSFSDLGHQVYILSPASELDLQGIECEKYFYTKKFEGKIEQGILNVRSYVLNLWKFFYKEINNVIGPPADDILVFFPYLDYLLECYVHRKEVDTIFQYNWSGLCMKPKNFRMKLPHHMLRKWLFDPNYLIQSKYCKAIGVFDSKAVTWLKQRYGKRIIEFPDVIDSSEPDFNYDLISEIQSRAKGKKIISLIGSIDRRKGVMTIISVLRELRALNYYPAFVGELVESDFSKEELNQIKNINGEIDSAFCSFVKIPDESKFNALIAVSDLIFAAYIDFPFSSNLIGKASYFNKPIVVSEDYYMGELVRKFKLGLTIPQGSEKELVRKLSNDSWIQDYITTNKTSEFNDNNSINLFEKQTALLMAEIYS